jgi:hypothetical protein
VFCQYEQPCEVISSEKDRSTTLHLLEDEEDPEGQDFVQVYGRPVYVMRNVSGKPITYFDSDILLMIRNTSMFHILKG